MKGKQIKPLGKKNYGSIPHLSSNKLGPGDYYINPGQERILTEKKRDKHDTILVFEKYDGSNVGVAKADGEIYALSRAGYEANTSPYKQHRLFGDWVKERKELFGELMNDGERITGEWLAQAHGLVYKIKNDPIVFFDYFNPKNERKSWDFLEGLAVKHGLPLPRLLHRGDAISVEELKPLLNQKTKNIQSAELPEGMVYRIERKEKVDFLAKWVRPDFDPGKYFVDKDDDELIWNV